MKKIIKIILIAFIMFSLMTIGIYALNKNPIGKVIDKYTYTKAICDETNYCEDYEIVCERANLKALNPTGYAIQNSADWEDPRVSDKQLCS